MNPKSSPRNHGFTLVELLIVIAIVVVLAAIGFGVGKSMLQKAKATNMMANLRQMMPIFNLYASENQLRLPACNGPIELSDGSIENMQWHEALLTYAYPKSSITDFRTEEWWDTNDSFFRNPIFEEDADPRGWSPTNPGYAFNLRLPENYAYNEDGSSPGMDELMEIRVPTAAIHEPNRTPMVIPYDNYYYTMDQSEVDRFDSSDTLQQFLNQDKLPVLFYSGSVEMLRPIEYLNRRLDESPR